MPVRKNGVLIPADNSFEAINCFVNHVPSPEYEELQWAMLGMASANDKLVTLVKDIKSYVEDGDTSTVSRAQTRQKMLQRINAISQ